MSGISGVFFYNNNPIDVEKKIDSLGNIINVKGKVFKNTFIYENIGICKVNKGSINDRPIENINNRYIIATDGYILNKSELVLMAGSKVSSNSSLEYVIAGLYDTYGVSFFPKLNGIFSLIIYDIFKKQLIIVPDRLGYKEVYFYGNEFFFCFSNDFDTLAKSKFIAKKINEKALCDIVNYNCIIDDNTILENIQMIPDGNFLSVSKNKKHFEQYWEFPLNNEIFHLPEHDLIDITSEIILNSVKKSYNLIKDLETIYIPISGGLDSRLFAGLLSHKTKNIQLLHVGSAKWPETAIAKHIAEQLQLEFQLFNFKSIDFKELEEEWNTYNNGNTLMNYFTRFLPMFNFICSQYNKSVAVDGIGIDILLQPAFLLEGIDINDKQILYHKIHKKFCFSSFNNINKYFNASFAKKIRQRAYDAIDETLKGNAGSNSIELCRKFYFKTRGRKLISSGNAFWESYCDFIFPGLDNDLFDHAVKIDFTFLKYGNLYRKCINYLLPELKEVKWAKTGKGILEKDSRIRNKIKSYKTRLYNKICEFSKGKIDLYTHQVSYDRLYRENAIFRDWINSILFSEEARNRNLYDYKNIIKLTEYEKQGKNLFRNIYTIVSIEKAFQNYLE